MRIREPVEVELEYPGSRGRGIAYPGSTVGVGKGCTLRVKWWEYQSTQGVEVPCDCGYDHR